MRRVIQRDRLLKADRLHPHVADVVRIDEALALAQGTASAAVATGAEAGGDSDTMGH